MSNVTILDEAPSPRMNGRTVLLCAFTAGWEPAGAGTRQTEGGFAVWFDLNGARCGQRYRTLHEARAHFARLVGDEVRT
jgi:hypothetical protein